MRALFLWTNTVFPKKFALIFAVAVIDGNKNMSQPESPDPFDMVMRENKTRRSNALV